MVSMLRTGIFVTTEELEAVQLAFACSGMWLSGGMALGDPEWEVECLRKKYNLPEGTGLDTKNGEFISEV